MLEKRDKGAIHACLSTFEEQARFARASGHDISLDDEPHDRQAQDSPSWTSMGWSTINQKCEIPEDASDSIVRDCDSPRAGEPD
jgi:hypothetical protein